MDIEETTKESNNERETKEREKDRNKKKRWIKPNITATKNGQLENVDMSFTYWVPRLSLEFHV